MERRREKGGGGHFTEQLADRDAAPAPSIGVGGGGGGRGDGGGSIFDRSRPVERSRSRFLSAPTLFGP